MTDRELMQQALEALEWVNTSPWLEDCYHAFDKEVAALRERLAQPEQEPVALEDVYLTIIQWDVGGGKRSRRELARRIVAKYTTPQPQMQPCAGRNCGSTNPNLHSTECFEDYEKATGMNQWQGLTDEEKAELDAKHGDDMLAHLDAVEAKLKEKNG